MGRGTGRRLALGLLALGGAVIVLVPAAFAHNSGLTDTALCNPATGNYDVIWSVGPTDNLDKSPVITESNRAAIAVGTALTAPIKTFSESVPGNTTTVPIALTAVWSDGYTSHLGDDLRLAGTCVRDTGTPKSSAPRVTVTTTTPETNASNNSAQAQTVVTAPVQPRTPAARSKSAKPVCTTVLALRKTLTANGKLQTVTFKVSQGRMGARATQGTTRVVARIRLKGPGISKTMRTAGNGLVSVSLKPHKAGIVTAEIVGAKACNTERLGVVSVFRPPPLAG